MPQMRPGEAAGCMVWVALVALIILLFIAGYAIARIIFG